MLEQNLTVRYYNIIAIFKHEKLKEPNHSAQFDNLYIDTITDIIDISYNFGDGLKVQTNSTNINTACHLEY